jgi:hypothetical protein
MAKPTARILWSLRLLAVTGPLLAGCGSASPVDMYFGTDAGADFVPPPRDGGDDGADDGADTADGGVD